MNSKQIFHNAKWIIVCKIVQSLLQLVIGMFTARYLGPSNYGLINYAASVVAFAIPITKLGFDATLVRELVEKPEKEGEILGTSLCLSLLSSLVCMAGVAGFVVAANANETLTILVCILYSLALIFTALELIQCWYQYKLFSKYSSIVSLVAYVVVSAYRVYLLASGKSVYWFALTNAFDYALISAALLVIYFKKGGQKFAFSWNCAKDMLSKSKHYILAALLIVVIQSTDHIMLTNMIGEQENGYYSAAITCAGVVQFVYVAIVDSYRPLILSLKKENETAYEQEVSRLYSMILYMAILQSIVFTVGAKWLVKILYGDEYSTATPILQILVWYVAFSYMGVVRNVWILAEEKQRYLSVINVTGALINVGMNLALIPIWGACGAAFASFLTQFLMNFVLGFIFKPIRRNNILILQGLRPKCFIDSCKNIFTLMKRRNKSIRGISMKKQRILLFVFSIILIFVVLFLAIWQTKKESVQLFSVKIATQDKTEIIDCWENEEGDCYLFLPSYATLSDAEILLNGETSFTLDGISLTEGAKCENFALNTPYILRYSAWGKTHEKKFTFLQSAEVPTIYIATQSENMEYIHRTKGNKEPGTLRLYTADGNLQYAGAFDALNGRGNYTWENYDKKPYSLHLTEAVDLLGMGAAQEWILLANGDDASNLKNKIVYDFADEAGLSYSPESTWVDLYLNGEYAGLYLLSERNEVHPERVDIAQEGSFLVSLELEGRAIKQQFPYVKTQSNQEFRIHYPANSDASKQFIAGKMQSVENALLAEDGIDPITGKSWLDLIDLDSWVRKYLLEEVFGNYDGGFVSQYFYYDGNKNDGKLYAGPAWDYGIAMNVESACTWVALTNPNALYMSRSLKENKPIWFADLYQKEEFYNRLVEVFKTDFYPKLSAQFTTTSDYVDKIQGAAKLNKTRWLADGENLEVIYAEIQSYMQTRLAFLYSLWVKKEPYYFIEIEMGYEWDKLLYAVKVGEPLHSLPTLYREDFLGWYYEGTDVPFDASAPINSDISIYAMWQENKSFFDSMLFKLAPIGVIAVMFLGLCAVEFVHLRRGKKNDET